MVNSSSQISTTSGISNTAIQAKNNGSSNADIISSFKEILSVMTAMSSMSSANPQSGSGAPGVGELMAPLMLLLLEKLVEGQVQQDPSSIETQQTSSEAALQNPSSSTNQGSKPEPSGRPIAGGVLTQEFHTGHTGIDIAIPTGTAVKSTMDGRVIHAGWNIQGYGNLVIVENGAYRTYYAHLSSIPVSVGDEVKAGTTMGLSGSTGNSTGPHLHYEIRKNKVAIDPAPVTLGAG
jgi:murein DD-endopeptidase MepM/ murein hydrolase activator NlpD